MLLWLGAIRYVIQLYKKAGAEPEYSKKTRSIPWLLMPWIVASQGVSVIGIEFVEKKQVAVYYNFRYLWLIRVGRSQKILMYFNVSENKL